MTLYFLENETEVAEIVFKTNASVPTHKIRIVRIRRRYSFPGLTSHMASLINNTSVNSNDEPSNNIENLEFDPTFPKYFCLEPNKQDLFRSTFCLLTSKLKRPSTGSRVSNAIIDDDNTSTNSACSDRNTGGGGVNVHVKTADGEIINKLRPKKHSEITPAFRAIHFSASAASFLSSFKEFQRKTLPILLVF